MVGNILKRTGFSHSWGEEIHSLVVEKGWNGDFIDWNYWAGLSNITPNQASKLYWCIDPIKWPDNDYAQGTITGDLQEKILRLKLWLEDSSNAWSLNDLANALGPDNLPFGMAEAVKKQRIDEVSKHCFDIESLELLTDEIKHDYYSRAAWTWVDAIYILQGYKPVYQLSTEQVRSHFPSLVNDFTQSIQLGVIGKEINQAGEKSFIDSPVNWQAFWQSIHKKPEPKAEVVVDDVRQVTEIGNQRNERELKQGLREIWVKEGRPKMKAFFPDKLKKHVNQPGSPITEVYTAGKYAGISYKTSYGSTGTLKKKTLSNYVSEFKKTP